MKRASWFLAIVLVAAGCGGGASATPGPDGGRTPGPEDASYSFEIIEVGLGEDGYVTLQNYTDIPSSLGALYLCESDRCVDLPDTTIQPDGVARIAAGDDSGIDDVVLSDAGLTLTPANGEIAVFASEDVDDPSAMRSYLQWGSTPHAMTDTAVEAGLWVATGYAPSAPHATRLWRTEESLWVWDPGS